MKEYPAIHSTILMPFYFVSHLTHQNLQHNCNYLAVILLWNCISCIFLSDFRLQNASILRGIYVRISSISPMKAYAKKCIIFTPQFNIFPHLFLSFLTHNFNHFSAISLKHFLDSAVSHPLSFFFGGVLLSWELFWFQAKYMCFFSCSTKSSAFLGGQALLTPTVQ